MALNDTRLRSLKPLPCGPRELPPVLQGLLLAEHGAARRTAELWRTGRSFRQDVALLRLCHDLMSLKEVPLLGFRNGIKCDHHQRRAPLHRLWLPACLMPARGDPQAGPRPVRGSGWEPSRPWSLTPRIPCGGVELTRTAEGAAAEPTHFRTASHWRVRGMSWIHSAENPRKR